jgi:hypothetical protein
MVEFSDQLEDKFLLRSMMNFGGVLEGIVEKFQVCFVLFVYYD